jgi:hypothetical protein
MRTIGLIIAFSFALAGPSFSGSTHGDLPGVGTFSYNGSSVISTEPATKVARLTLTRRA